MYDRVRKYDTEDDWTYWCGDEELKRYVGVFIDRNRFFAGKFRQYNITSYDTSSDRDRVPDGILNKYACKTTGSASGAGQPQGG